MTWRNLLLTKEKDQLHLGENLVAETGEMIEGIENVLDQGPDHARIDVVKKREENANVKKNEDENVKEEKRKKGEERRKGEEKGGEEKNGRGKKRNVNAKKEGKDFRKKRR